MDTEHQQKPETRTIRMKIDTQNFFEHIIEGINKASDMLQEPYEPEEGDEYGRELPRGLQYVDIGLKILVGYINDISARAIELKDPVLLDLLQSIHAITEKEAQCEPTSTT